MEIALPDELWLAIFERAMLSMRQAMRLRLVSKQFRRVCLMLTLEGNQSNDDIHVTQSQRLCGITDRPGPVFFGGLKTLVVWAACCDIRPRPFGVHAHTIREIELYYARSPDGSYWTEDHFVAIFTACVNLKSFINVGMAVRSTNASVAVVLPKRLEKLRIKTSSMPVLFQWKLFEWGLSNLVAVTVGRWYGAGDKWELLWRNLPRLSKVRVDDCPFFDTRACEMLYRHCKNLSILEILDHNAQVSPGVMFGGATQCRKLEHLLFDRDSIGAVTVSVPQEQVMDTIQLVVGSKIPFPALRHFAVRGYDISASCMMQMLWRSALLEQVGVSCTISVYLVFRVMMMYSLPSVRVYHEIVPADI